MDETKAPFRTSMLAVAILGELTAQATGPLPLRDSFIATIVRSRGYRIVTRDVVPFERLGCKVVNSWSS